jgi:uncharacterized protein YodC (DUF2158 family)
MNLEDSIQQAISLNNEKLLSQIAAMLSQKNFISNKGGAEMPRKLKYGQGCITKRKRINKKGSIYEWYEVKWVDEYGKRQSQTAKTQEQAHHILLKFNTHRIKNTNKKQIKVFGTYLMEWYETFGNRKSGVKRDKLYRVQIARIPQDIMNKPIGQVTAQELQGHLDNIEIKHGGNNKLWAALLLKAFLKHAFNDGQIKSNIGALLIADKPPVLRNKNILPQDREGEFLSLFPSKYRPYVVGFIYTGCRISEFMTIGRFEDTCVDKGKGILKCRETKSIYAKDRRAGINYRIREIPILPPLQNFVFPLPEISK